MNKPINIDPTPLPHFKEVKESNYIIYCGDPWFQYIISKSPGSGRKYRYDLIFIHIKNGTAECRGRELPLKNCRKIVSDIKKYIKEQEDRYNYP
jgi:hypothetical protein